MVDPTSAVSTATKVTGLMRFVPGLNVAATVASIAMGAWGASATSKAAAQNKANQPQESLPIS